MPPGVKRKRAKAEPSAGESRKHREEPKTAFDWLLSTAITPAAFFKQHWEKRHFFAQLSRSGAHRYDKLAVGLNGAVCNGTRQPLFDTTRLLEIARLHGPLELGRQLQVMQIGEHGRESAETPEDGLASAAWLEARLEEGFTVQLFQPQHWCDRLWALLAAMEAELGGLCGCSVYHTPSGCQGLAAHHDDVEVFILQTAGRKRWRLYPPLDGHALPATPSADLAEERLGPCLLDITVAPGDLLYLPRGVVHQAVSLEGASSTHLTLSSYQRHAWADLLGVMLPRAIERASHASLELRRGLPVGFLTHAGSAASAGSGAVSSRAVEAQRGFETAASAALQQVLDVALRADATTELAHEAADEIGADFMQNRLPPCRPVAAAVASGPPPSLEAPADELEMRLCAPSLRRLVLGSHAGGDDFVQVQHCLHPSPRP